ncbi:MAG: hypothetical protein SFW63_05335 [Alphaproteobacteria bacterium]|nr:hypothetical protein [Alphaproteobacteria bacterium]
MTSKPKSASPLQGFTLLIDQEIWGDKALQVMKAYGTKTGMSDLAVLLGGAVSNSSATTSDGQWGAYVWSASSDAFGLVRAVNYYGDRGFNNPSGRLLGARPALLSSVASSIRLSDSSPEALAKGEAIRGEPIRDANGQVIWNDVILFGEYPQKIADENITSELKGLSEAQLEKMETGKTYTFDSEKRDAYDKPFNAKQYPEYQYKGKKYIRVEAKPDGEGYSMLSNGEQAQAGQTYWVEVQPIEWLRDPSGICVARQALFAGVQFDRKKKYDGNFENTDMYRYLNTHFAQEIIPSQSLKQSQAKDKDAKPRSGWPAAASWAERHPSAVTTPWGEAVQDPKSGEWIAR